MHCNVGMPNKKIPAEAGKIRGNWNCARRNSVQSGPAHQLYCSFLQVEIAGQHGLYVTRVTAHIHGLTQLDHTAEFVATAILRVGQYELCVVLRGHGLRLRLAPTPICETQHKMPDSRSRPRLCCDAAFRSSRKALSRRKIRAFRRRGAQILGRSICNIEL